MLSSKTALLKKPNPRFCFSHDSNRISTQCQYMTEWKSAYSLTCCSQHYIGDIYNSIYKKTKAAIVCGYTHIFFSFHQTIADFQFYWSNICVWTGACIENIGFHTTAYTDFYCQVSVLLTLHTQRNNYKCPM